MRYLGFLPPKRDMIIYTIGYLLGYGTAILWHQLGYI